MVFRYKMAVRTVQTKQPVKDFWKADYGAMQRELGGVDWEGKLEDMDAIPTPGSALRST